MNYTDPHQTGTPQAIHLTIHLTETGEAEEGLIEVELPGEEEGEDHAGDPPEETPPAVEEEEEADHPAHPAHHSEGAAEAPQTEEMIPLALEMDKVEKVDQVSEEEIKRTLSMWFQMVDLATAI